MSAILRIYRMYTFLVIFIHTSPVSSDFFHVTAFNQDERSLLYQMHIHNESLVFLNGITNEAAIPMQVIVDDCCTDIYQNTLKEHGVEYSRIDIDLRDEDTNYEKPEYYSENNFLQWKSIESWINKKQQKNPILKKQILARTYEKREVFTLSLVKDKNNPMVVVVGGEQGKDWMSVAIILDCINNFFKDAQLDVLLDYFSFYFVPILNPDGYVFSMEKDEFWSKNRKVFFPKKKCDWPTYSESEDTTAVGVNIERNWFYENTYNAQEDICNSVYLGNRPLSEEETKGLAKFLNKHAKKLMAFINVIGYGNRLITLPYANQLQNSINHGIMLDTILSACERLRNEYNVTYFCGQSARFFYNITGNCADWVKFKLNVPLVYTIYMQYKDEIIPYPRDIKPLSEQLGIILEETLLISKEVYGPLFEKSNKNFVGTNISLIIILILIL